MHDGGPSRACATDNISPSPYFPPVYGVGATPTLQTRLPPSAVATCAHSGKPLVQALPMALAGGGAWEVDSPLAWNPTPAPLASPPPAHASLSSARQWPGEWTGSWQHWRGPVDTSANWTASEAAQTGVFGGRRDSPSEQPMQLGARWEGGPGLPQPYGGHSVSSYPPWASSQPWAPGGGVAGGEPGPRPGAGSWPRAFHANFSHHGDPTGKVVAPSSLLAPNQAWYQWPPGAHPGRCPAPSGPPIMHLVPQYSEWRPTHMAPAYSGSNFNSSGGTSARASGSQAQPRPMFVPGPNVSVPHGRPWTPLAVPLACPSAVDTSPRVVSTLALAEPEPRVPQAAHATTTEPDQARARARGFSGGGCNSELPVAAEHVVTGTPGPTAADTCVLPRIAPIAGLKFSEWPVPEEVVELEGRQSAVVRPLKRLRTGRLAAAAPAPDCYPRLISSPPRGLLPDDPASLRGLTTATTVGNDSGGPTDPELGGPGGAAGPPQPVAACFASTSGGSRHARREGTQVPESSGLPSSAGPVTASGSRALKCKFSESGCPFTSLAPVPSQVRAILESTSTWLLWSVGYY